VRLGGHSRPRRRALRRSEARPAGAACGAPTGPREWVVGQPGAKVMVSIFYSPGRRTGPSSHTSRPRAIQTSLAAADDIRPFRRVRAQKCGELCDASGRASMPGSPCASPYQASRAACEADQRGGDDPARAFPRDFPAPPGRSPRIPAARFVQRGMFRRGVEAPELPPRRMARSRPLATCGRRGAGADEAHRKRSPASRSTVSLRCRPPCKARVSPQRRCATS